MCPNSTYWEADLRFHGAKYGLGDEGKGKKGGFGGWFLEFISKWRPARP